MKKKKKLQLKCLYGQVKLKNGQLSSPYNISPPIYLLVSLIHSLTPLFIFIMMMMMMMILSLFSFSASLGQHTPQRKT
jgi:succinate dehydrogenase/fumarate reductase cytochrome b subunit